MWKLLKNKFVQVLLAFILGFGVASLSLPERVEQIVQTVSQIDTLLVEGPTVYKTRFIYREVEPDTLYVTEYEQAPAIVSVVSATITGDQLRIEYLVNDSLHSVTVGVDLPPYGDTYISVDPDSGLVAQTQRVGFHPELTGGVNLRGIHAGLDLWYWNDVLIFRAVHFPSVAGGYTIFEDENKIVPMAGFSADIHANTPLRLGVYGVWDDGLGFTSGLEIPLWSYKN